MYARVRGSPIEAPIVGFRDTIKVILNSITRFRLIIHIEDPKEAFSVNYTYIEDTKVEEIIIADIITTGYFVRSNTISVINPDAG